jgi:hypothetical protein
MSGAELLCRLMQLTPVELERPVRIADYSLETSELSPVIRLTVYDECVVMESR